MPNPPQTAPQEELKPIQKASDLIPQNWLDPILTGPQAVVRNDGGDIERVLNAVKTRIQEWENTRPLLPEGGEGERESLKRARKRIYRATPKPHFTASYPNGVPVCGECQKQVSEDGTKEHREDCLVGFILSQRKDDRL